MASARLAAAGAPRSRAAPRKGLPSVALVALAFLGFISLGLPDGLLGVAWPSIRRSFGVPLDGLGALLVATTAGYLAASLASGWVVARLGVGRLLALSGFLTGLGLLGYAAAPGWWTMVALGLPAGLGAGAIDAGLNAYVAVNHSPRFLNWLHASYGVGAAAGPLLMTTVLEMGQSWRLGYLLVGLLQGALGTCFLLTAGRWALAGDVGTRGHGDAGGGERASTTAGGLWAPLVWLSVGLFAVYTGLEASAGQWSYSLLVEGRGVAPSVAGVWVSVYWGGLALGRVLLGSLANRLAAAVLVRAAMLGVLLGTLLLWANPSEAVSFAGLALMGLAAGPIFPTLIASTPGRLGPARAAAVIGFQVGAAGLGLALGPGLGGLLAERFGLGSIAPFLVAAAVAMLGLHEAVVRQG